MRVFQSILKKVSDHILEWLFTGVDTVMSFEISEVTKSFLTKGISA